jgi:hypothetical protein
LIRENGKVTSIKRETKENKINQEKEQKVCFLKTYLKGRDEHTNWQI